MITEKFKIRANESDKNGFVKMSSLVGYLIEIAGEDADKLNFGFDDLDMHGKYWVLSRLLIEIKELPKWRDEIVIMTWPKGINKLFALRDFVILDKREVEIIKVTSAWLVLDRKTNRPCKVEDVISDFNCIIKKDSIEFLPNKIGISNEVKFIYSKKVLSSDIDVNLHVNSCKYIDWVIDCLDKQIENILSFQINFLSSAKLNDIIELRATENYDYIEATNFENENRIINAKIIYSN
ncbi:MAG: hypothetical protein JXA68_04195 [Ignavibacteriales bacterium]|nr:hypothetical protein [Ignavibacteriales bacterium]